MSPRPNQPPRRPARKARARTDRRRRAAEVRRRQTTAVAVANPSSPTGMRAPGRKPWALLSAAIALVLVAAVVIVLVARGGDDDDPVDAVLTAPLAAEQGGEWVLDEPLPAYRIVYRAEDHRSDELVVTTSELTVRRPFQSLRVVKAGPPPGGEMETTSIHDFATYSRLDSKQPDASPTSTVAGESTTTPTAPAEPTPDVYQYTPQFANGDVRLDATLADLLADGSFEPVDRRTLLGRDCQVYRTGQAVEGAGVSKPSEVAYALACIDRTGLVLEEIVVENGEVARHITATSIDTAIAPADADFAITGEPLPIEEGALALTALPLDAPPAPTYWVLDAPPAGYTHERRFQLAAAQLDSSGKATTNPDGTTVTSLGYADVYRSGTRAVVIIQGPTSLQSLQISVDGPTVRVGGLGTGEVAASPLATRLIATPANPGNWVVRIDATMSVEEVTALAKTMHTVAGPAPTTTTSTTTTVPTPSTVPTTGAATTATPAP